MQLEFENLTVRYGEREALKPFNACLREGGLIGLIGPNGAGKSTLLRCTATLLRPSAGRLYLDGADVTRQPALLRRVLGYLPQEPALYPELTPREFDLLVFLLRHPHRVFTREELLDRLWEYPCPVDTRTVDTHIQRLRKKLAGAVTIETVFSVGYKYVPEG